VAFLVYSPPGLPATAPLHHPTGHDSGTSVTWTNNDHFTHSVRVQDGPDHVIKPGENVTIPFDTAGEYSYICTFHAQDMKGTVMVSRS
jgi:plastocyanin